MRAVHVGVVVGAVLVSNSASTDAHFKLLAPASWLVSNDRGDPQQPRHAAAMRKTKACPVTSSAKPSAAKKPQVRVQETVYHPGHYRVALAVNSRDELPPDPVTTTRETKKGPRSIWAVVQSPPQKPVPAHGLFPRCTRVRATPQTYRGGRPAPEHQLREVHAPDRSVDGRARVERARRVHLSPLRRPADHRRPGKATLRRVGGSACARSQNIAAGVLVGLAIESGSAQQGRIVGLNHVAVSVADYAGATDFYGRQMGFRQAFSFRGAGRLSLPGVFSGEPRPTFVEVMQATPERPAACRRISGWQSSTSTAAIEQLEGARRAGPPALCFSPA